MSGLEHFYPVRPIQLLAGFALLLSIGGACVLLFISESDVLRFGLSFLLLVSINGLLSFYLSTLYFLASKLYRDTFYFLLGIAWITLAIQVYSQQFFTPPYNPTVTYNIATNLLQLVPTIIFYVASLFPVNSKPNALRIATKTVAWLLQIIITIAIIYWLIGSNTASSTFISLLFFGAQAPFTAWALIHVGKGIEKRVGLSYPFKWVNILPISFYAYGILQIFYLFEYLTVRSSIMGFTLGLLLKVVNGIALLKVMLVEFDGLQNQLIQRSVFEDIGALTASVEHDIRSPLGIINVEIDRMKTKFQSDPEMLTTISRIDEQTQRIFASTQLVTMLRGDADFYQRSMEKVNVVELAKWSVKTVKRDVMTSNIYFKVADSKVMFIKANAPMLEQVIVNILKNAVEGIRAANRKTGTIKVELKASPQSPQTVLINITDNGCGITEEDIPKLTSIFTTKTNREPNSGIGLFISERILKLHRGQLEIRSRVGEGTTVSILLPKWNPQE